MLLFILFFALLASSSLASAQLAPEARRGLLKAQWITSPDTPQRDTIVLHFRKVFEIPQKPEHFFIHVSADNQFFLSVNQHDVGRGPSLSDLAHWKYERYDLAGLLSAGRNEITATVWNFGVLSPLAQISDRTAFVLEGETDGEQIVNTDKSWQVEEEKGLTLLPTPPNILRFYYVAEPAERIDGASFDWAWNDAVHSTGKWTNAASIGNAISRGAVLQNINWQLLPDSLPPMQLELTSVGRVVRASGIRPPWDFPNVAAEIPAHSSVTLLLDQSHLTTAYPEITLGGGAGATVRLTYAEALVDEKGQKGNRNEIEGKHIVGIFDEFLPDGAASRQFMPLGWRTWRYLQIDLTTADQPLRIEKLRAWFTAFPFEERARFESNEESLGRIWETGWRTARLDAHDTYMDTPYWERMQYIGDTRIQALLSYTIANDDRLARQAIEAFNHSRIDDGITRSRYPSSVTQIIPTFSLLWVGMVHDFWRYRDDEAFVKAQLPGTRTVMDWFLARQRTDGLLGDVPWWPFVDWGKDFAFGVPPQDENGGSSVITLQYIEALRYAEALETAFGDLARTKSYREAELRAVNAVRGLCWNETHNLIADTPSQKHFSQHANILGVWLDVVPGGKQQEVLTRVLASSDPGFATSGPAPEMTHATYYFRFYLARALEHVGLGDRYLDLLKPWEDMIALGLTTWAEQPEPSRSDSHAWSAHPNFDFLTIVAGIRPKAPGFSSVTIEPHLGRLRSVASTFPTPKGAVEVKYATTPSGIAAEVILPQNVDGELIWKGQINILHSGQQKMLLP
jgi:hypothetical protein